MAAASCHAAANAETIGKKRQKQKQKQTATAIHSEEAAQEQSKSPSQAKQGKPQEKEGGIRTTPRPQHFVINLSPAQLDSLVSIWQQERTEQTFNDYYQNFISPETAATIPADSKAAAIPDSVYANRLAALASPVQLPYNSVVKTAIVRYLDDRRGVLERILARSKFYFPMIEDELIRQGLPVELRMMPVIESALSPQAVSKAGAAGMWQFMPSTGKSFGLEVNSLVDERLDPIASTRAGCKYLRDLYNIYNDWSLAIAAYNCGPGNVNKAIARAGQNSKSFWDIYAYLPAETRSYIPAFIAATYVCAYHKLHGVEAGPSPLPLATDTVTVNRIMHLGQVASTIDLPTEVLQQLNPQYKKDIIPATTRNYSLVLPLQFVSKYIENENEIFSKDSLYLKEFINPANVDKMKLERQVVTYTVKKGDTLGAIASRNRVTVKELMRWNGLKNDKLRIGQKLRIEKRQ